MEHIYAVSSNEELQKYQDFVSDIQSALSEYIAYLRSEFRVTDLPRTILWTSEKIATQLLSDIPIPAYTNDYRIVMCPDLDVWQNLYLKQLDGLSSPAASDIRCYYGHNLNRHNILQILGHELAHHSKLFIDEVYDSGEGVWFEEGMAEYISRRFFLTGEEFNREAQINRLLIDLYIERHGNHPLDSFGASTYQNSIADIFFEYWRSFLAVSQIVDCFAGDIQAVFHFYHRWYQSGRTQSLAQWFQIDV